MTDSTCSLSGLSEPHIKNWFSTYVYKSPLLYSPDDVKESVAKESACEKEEFASKVSKRKREDKFEHESRNSWNSNEVDPAGGKLCSNGLVNCENSFEDTLVNKSSNEIPDSSPSTLSEPPDTRNWFFSYVYGSLESKGLIEKEVDCEDLVNQHNNKEKERNLWKFGKTRITDEAVIDEKVFSNGFLKSNNSLRGDEQKNQSLNKGIRASGNGSSSTLDNLSCEKRQSIADKIFSNHRISSTNNLEKGSLNGECPPYKQQQKPNFLQASDFMTYQRNTNSRNNDRASPTKLNLRKDLAENLKTKVEMGVDLVSSATNMDFVPVVGDLNRKSTRESNNKENEGKEVQESGFVTTKNRCIANDENSVHKPQKILSECSRNKRITSDCGKGAIKRKALSERTNLEQTDAIKITGKWRCPQKTRPNIGPLRKQLRLERWVHRL
ncbi:uncharacterized protein LOC110654525 isoform X2 [Hevea brasiliensis]|nr:uncharacterized protein LOC110654525 isoform X2 [Hevea brasiliensis]